VRKTVLSALALAASLAVPTLAAQRAPGADAAGISLAPPTSIIREDASLLTADIRHTSLPRIRNGDLATAGLDCGRAGGECGRSVAKHTFVGTAAGAGVALLYGLGVCLPRSFAPERRGCSGAVPVVAVGTGALVGIITGLASRHCHGAE
jgi:hypothetical protein